MTITEQHDETTIARALERSRHHGELLTLLRQLVRDWPGDRSAPAVEAARTWLRTHCRGCGIAISRGDACRPCQQEWARQLGAADVA